MCQALKELIEEGKFEGMEAGRLEGIEAGRLEGEEQMARLAQTLMAQGKMEELKRALSDAEYRRSLFAGYGMA